MDIFAIAGNPENQIYPYRAAVNMFSGGWGSDAKCTWGRQLPHTYVWCLALFLKSHFMSLYLNQISPLLSFQKTIWHWKQHCFHLHFIKCILALNHLIFSRLCYVKYHNFHLCFSFVNCCFLFRLILDVTNSAEINGMTWRINAFI